MFVTIPPAEYFVQKGIHSKQLIIDQIIVSFIYGRY